MEKIDKFINESFFKNLNVGEYAKIEALLKEWEKTKNGAIPVPMIKSGTWEINKDYSVTVFGYVQLQGSDFEKLPFKFRKVYGFFSVNNCKNLTTLEGCPEEVNGWFGCNGCLKLTSLNDCPKYVSSNFYAQNCGKKFTEAKVKKHCEVKGYINI